MGNSINRTFIDVWPMEYEECKRRFDDLDAPNKTMTYRARQCTITADAATPNKIVSTK